MNTQLTFTETIPYPDNPEGIVISATLTYGGVSFTADAKVDTGAAVCLFSREIGEIIGLPIESGIPIRLSTLTGSLDAFGHEITLRTGSLTFYSTIYFAKNYGLPRNLLGRIGWLRNIKLAVIDYDNRLYLSLY